MNGRKTEEFPVTHEELLPVIHSELDYAEYLWGNAAMGYGTSTSDYREHRAGIQCIKEIATVLSNDELDYILDDYCDSFVRRNGREHLEQFQVQYVYVWNLAEHRRQQWNENLALIQQYKNRYKHDDSLAKLTDEQLAQVFNEAMASPKTADIYILYAVTQILDERKKSKLVDDLYWQNRVYQRLGLIGTQISYRDQDEEGCEAVRQ